MSKKKLLDRHGLSKLLGCHPQSVNRWASDGMPVAQRGRGGRPSLYDPEKCQAWIEARRAVDGTDRVDVPRERARKERAQALLAEQLYATRAGELLPAGEVRKVWDSYIAATRARILSTYTTSADRVARAATRGGVADVEGELKDIAYEILRELASGTDAESTS